MPRVLAFLALLLLVAFFLPWSPDVLGVGNGTTMSGFDLTYAVVLAAKDAVSQGASVGDMMQGDAWQAYILVLIPVFGVLTVLFGLANAGIASLTAFLAGVPAVVVTVKGLIEAGADTFDGFEIGAWATLALSVLLVLLAFAPKRRV